jgi:Ran GTPase-activating protein (RanGAP) involved in mRNA processing and transport
MTKISPKSLKSSSTSDYKKIMEIIQNTFLQDTQKCLDMFETIIDQLKIDNENYKNGNFDKITDCGLFAPRHSGVLNSSKNPIRLACYGAKRFFIDSGKMSKQEHANIHWQRLVAKLAKTYVEEKNKEAALKAEYKTYRVLEHQRTNWCCLLKREISKAVGKPTAMPVDVAPKEELLDFFAHLAQDKPIDFKQFKRCTVFSDGRMDACKQVVGELSIGDLMDSLKTNTQIKHFLLGNNITNTEGGKAICKFLSEPHSCQIKTWYLAGSDFNSEAIKYICDGLMKNNDCEALWLKRNPIYVEGVKHIANLLKTNKTIKILDLDNCGAGLKNTAYTAQNPYENHISTDGISVLFDALKTNNVLRHLYLDANALDEKFIKFIADYFMFKTKINDKGITSLWIGMNKLGDNGVKTLCESLKDYPYLKRLCLGSVMMSDVGMKYVCENFANHKGLKVLDLGLYKSTADMGLVPNNISNDGYQYICKLIEGDNNIRYLNISMNNIDSDHMNYIVDSLDKNNKIVYFVYKQYGQEIKQNVIRRINNILDRNRVLYMQETNIDCTNDYVRILKHSNKVKNIDSIYRNSMK